VMAIGTALAVAAISVSPLGGVLAQRFDAAFVYVSKVLFKRLVGRADVQHAVAVQTKRIYSVQPGIPHVLEALTKNPL